MEKFAFGFVKWIALPAAVGAAGFFFVGPMIGKESGTPPPIQEIEAPTPDVQAEPVPTPEPKPKKVEDKPVKSKFDAEVPQRPAKSEQDDPSIGVDRTGGSGADTIHVERAPTEAKPRPKPRKPSVPKTTPETDDPASTPSATKPKVTKPANPDRGPGEDVTTLKPKAPKAKPIPKPEKKPADLPSTPEEPKDPGGSDGGV